MSATSRLAALDDVFFLPNGFAPQLGISASNSHLANFNQTLFLSTNLAELRIRVELFETNNQAAFYDAEIKLGQNMAFAGEWQPNLGVFVAGMEPLPYAWPHTNSDAVAVFHNGRNIFPVNDGRLKGGRVYRIKITVLDPIPMTNQLSFWIYLHHPEDPITKTYRRLKEKL